MLVALEKRSNQRERERESEGKHVLRKRGNIAKRNSCRKTPYTDFRLIHSPAEGHAGTRWLHGRSNRSVFFDYRTIVPSLSAIITDKTFKTLHESSNCGGTNGNSSLFAASPKATSTSFPLVTTTTIAESERHALARQEAN